MTFWIIVALMVVGAAAALVLPLFRGTSHGAVAAEYDLEVYRDQLAELERDRDRGVITDDEMEAARTEIVRRMLAADTRMQEQAGRGPARRGVGVPVLGGCLVVFLGAGAVAFYLQTGSPGAPDMPLALRTDLPVRGQQDDQLRQQVAVLERAAEANPTDIDAWLRLADAYRSAEMFDAAADAYRRAIGLGEVAAEINGDFAETLVMAADGTVTPEARAIFESVSAVAPADPRPQFYLALAD